MMVAVFGTAMTWASACSVMCALGVCPLEMHFARNAGLQSSSGNSASPHHHNADPDCALHNHPSIFVEKVPGSPHLGPEHAGRLYAHVAALEAFPSHEIAATSATSGASDLAPPGAWKLPRSQQTLVLRI